MTSNSPKYDSCPLPDRSTERSDVIRRMLAGRRIAIVGLSDDPSRPSFGVARYLKSVGKEIIPINPNLQTVMGLKCFARLQDVPGPIDVVDVFRRAEFCPEIVRAAIEIKAGGVWLQSGIVSPEAEAIARSAEIPFVQNRCLKVDHMMSQSSV